jgi:DNA-binding NarL/FixJ family response regulator
LPHGSSRRTLRLRDFKFADPLLDQLEPVERAGEHRPLVACLDGISATRGVLTASPGSEGVILTTFEQDAYIFGALAAGGFGFSGFLLKRTTPEELIAAVHAIAAATRCSQRR